MSNKQNKRLRKAVKKQYATIEMKVISDLLHLPLKERIQIAWRIIMGAK